MPGTLRSPENDDDVVPHIPCAMRFGDPTSHQRANRL